MQIFLVRMVAVRCNLGEAELGRKIRRANTREHVTGLHHGQSWLCKPPCHLHMGGIDSCILAQSAGRRRRANSLSTGFFSPLSLFGQSPFRYALNPTPPPLWIVTSPSSSMWEGRASEVSPCQFVLYVGTLECVTEEVTAA